MYASGLGFGGLCFFLSCDGSCDGLLTGYRDIAPSGVLCFGVYERNACLQLRIRVPREGTLRVIKDGETMGVLGK